MALNNASPLKNQALPPSKENAAQYARILQVKPMSCPFGHTL